MKVIIPVAGVGTRLRPHTHTVPKALIPVAGKPVIAHILDKLVKFDVTDLILVVGYLGDKIVKYVEDHYKFNVEFVEQKRRLGLGHAIHLAQTHVNNEEPLLIILGDTLFDANLKPVIQSDYNEIGVKHVTNPERFGIVNMNERGFIENFVEKPDVFLGDLAVVGVYYIKSPSTLFDALQYVTENDIRTKGEYQLTDALNQMLIQGVKMKTFEVDAWYDCGKPETLLDTNRRLLQKQKKRRLPKIPNAILIPPVSIGKNVKIENSIVGPHVTVAADSMIRKSIVEDTIIASNAVVQNICLKNSIIGEFAHVFGRSKKLNVGDSSEVDLA